MFNPLLPKYLGEKNLLRPNDYVHAMELGFLEHIFGNTNLLLFLD